MSNWPKPTVPQPSLEEIMEEDFDSDGTAQTTDGCYVEPDGTCEHGHPSWQIVLGLI